MAFFANLAAGGRPSGPGLLAALEALAADMEGVTAGALASDATLWANALPRAARLVGSPVLVLGGDPAIQARLAGELADPAADGAWAVLAEALARLAETRRGEQDLVLILPGPGRWLAAGLTPADVKARLVAHLERLCSSRPALVLLDEADGASLAGPDCRRLAGTLRNVADYYGVGLGLRLSAAADPVAVITATRALRLAHLLLTGPVADPVACLAAATAAGWHSLGLSMPVQAVEAPGSTATLLWFALDASSADIEALKAAFASTAA